MYLTLKVLFCVTFLNNISFVINTDQKNIENEKNIVENKATNKSQEEDTTDYIFSPLEEEFLDFDLFGKKYNPTAVWETIDKKKKIDGEKITDREQMDLMFEQMDQTDELLQMNISEEQSGRRQMLGWVPIQDYSYMGKDLHYLRERLFDLMRQAIYQARAKMIVMQNYRARYRRSGLYKMGFLTNKLDNLCKQLGRVAHKALRACVAARQNHNINQPPTMHLHACSRMIFIWFDIELLTELIRKNDSILRRVLETHSDHVAHFANKEFFN